MSERSLKLWLTSGFRLDEGDFGFCRDLKFTDDRRFFQVRAL
jgi:hypothetical protein